MFLECVDVKLPLAQLGAQLRGCRRLKEAPSNRLWRYGRYSLEVCVDMPDLLVVPNLGWCRLIVSSKQGRNLYCTMLVSNPRSRTAHESIPLQEFWWRQRSKHIGCNLAQTVGPSTCRRSRGTWLEGRGCSVQGQGSRLQYVSRQLKQEVVAQQGAGNSGYQTF